MNEQYQIVEQHQIEFGEDTKLKRKRVIFLIISIFIALILIAPKDVTWARDRLNYLIYAQSSWNIMQSNLSRGIFNFFANEPLFLTINILLSFVFSPENILRIIIFISAVGVLSSLGKISNYNFWVLVFFLFIPEIIKNHIIHLRQGLGLSFYLVGLTSSKKYGKFIKFSAMFIHTSFVFVILYEFLEAFFKKLELKFSLRILCSSILLIIFIFAVPVLALLFGDRRLLEYNFTMEQEASGLGLLLWLALGSFFIFIIEKNYNNIICCYGIIMYILSYFFLEFGARIFENIIPLILVGVLTDDRKEVRIIFILFFLLYGTIQWYLKGFNFLI